MALQADGSLWAWGSNSHGQLGDGFPLMHSEPVEISGLEEVISLSTRENNNMALTADGSVWVWGSNGAKQPRMGHTPFRVENLTEVKAIAAGESHSLALKEDGSLWAWGMGMFLGNGSMEDQRTPVPVQGLSGITAVAAGAWHTLALKSDGTVWAWGWNEAGELGDGTYINRMTPVQVKDLTDIIAIAAGGQEAGCFFDHSLALKADGTLWTWGNNRWGQLGDGTGDRSRNFPMAVKSLKQVTDITAGADHSLARTSDGRVWAWGRNMEGQVGDGSTTNRSLPVEIKGLTKIRSLAGAFSFSLGLQENGPLYFWGKDFFGPLDKQGKTYPLPFPRYELEGITAVAVGSRHCLALTSEGRVLAWGHDNWGQLGLGRVVSTCVPIPVCLDGAYTAREKRKHSGELGSPL